MVEKDRNDSFLSRWSYRKALSADQPDKENINANDKPKEERSIKNQEVIEEKVLAQTGKNYEGIEKNSKEEQEMAENLAAAEAIDLETLSYDSDYELFLKEGVPEELKNQAMRKLWRSNPVLANVDGLNDYDENFADPALNTFTSIWQVGKGFLTEKDKHEPLVQAVSSLANTDQKTGDDEAISEAVTELETEIEILKSQESDAENQDLKNEQRNVLNTEENWDKENEIDDAQSQENLMQSEVQRVSIRQRLFET
jgi:hypothetical protein